MTICKSTAPLSRSIVGAIAWAVVMLLIAVGEIVGLLPEKMTTTLIVIVPALAVISIYGPGCRKSAA